MTEKTKHIPFSTIQRKIRELMRKPGSQKVSLPLLNFMPKDMEIWIRGDSDFFRRAYCHHRMILKIILSGRASTCIDGIRYQLHPSDAVLYFPMQTHSTETEDDEGSFEYLAITFVAGMGRYEELNALKNRVFSPDPRLLPGIIRAWKEKRQILAAGMLAELLAEAIAGVSGTVGKEQNDFGRIAEYIRENCGGSLSVKKIAAEFDVSPQTVKRIFQRNIHGLTPGSLIRQQRMVLAAELLRRTDLPMRELSEKCGFSSVFSFSRAFRREYGIPPSLYRRNKWEP